MGNGDGANHFIGLSCRLNKNIYVNVAAQCLAYSKYLINGSLKKTNDNVKSILLFGNNQMSVLLFFSFKNSVCCYNHKLQAVLPFAG